MIVEIVNPQGKVSYTRPHEHPDVLEALKTPGYSVRCSESAEADSLQRVVSRPMPEWFGPALAAAQHQDTINSWPKWARWMHKVFRSHKCPACQYWNGKRSANKQLSDS